MRHEIVRARVVRAVAEHLDVDPAKLTDRLALDDLGLDAVQRLELVRAIERAIGVTMTEPDIERLRTLADLVGLALSLVTNAARGVRGDVWPLAWVRLAAADGRVLWERVGSFTPYVVGLVVEDALRAGPRARLEAVVATDAPGDAVARLTRTLARAQQAGVEVMVTRGRGLPPVAQRRTPDEGAPRLRALAALATRLAAVLHELQHERSLTSLHVASAGRKLGPELCPHRERTDSAVVELHDAAGTCRARLPGPVREHLSRVNDALGGLAGARTLAEAGPDGLGAMMQAFVRIAGELLGAIESIAAVTPDAEWGRLAKSYLALLRAKETATLERAQLASTVEISGSLPPGHDVAFGALMAAERSFLDLFASTAHPEALSAWHRTTADSSFREAQRLERLALERPGLPLDAERVFSVLACKIDRLHEVEVVQLERLINRAAVAAAS